VTAARVEAAAGGTGVPVVAIVGRPNVGKSALFNRLVRAHRAIVDDAPGVTRDRVVAPALYEGRAFLCVDTGGFAVDAPRDRDSLAARVRAQTLTAIEEADCVVCVFDGQEGVTAEDREIVRLLRRSGKPVVWAVNKLDTPARDPLLYEFQAAGVAEALPVSAAHGRHLQALVEEVAAALPAPAGVAAETAPGTRLALVGRPNVGKSSLLNRLVGTERAIVAPDPGTTRDTIDTAITVGGRPYVLIDTAGIRRRTRVRESLERHGAVRALGTLVRTDLALVVLDSAEGMTDQDARLIGRAWDAGRGVIILANKWDTLPAGGRDPGAFRDRIRALRPAFAELPLLPVSARTGEGLARIFPLVARVEQAYQAELPTAALNRALRRAVAAHAPPSPRGRAIRLLYATQTGRRPPAVAVFASAPAAIPSSYVRYLAGQLTAAFGLIGVPIRVSFRARPRAAVPAPRRHRARR
jgi:GTP-binding protein